MSTDGVNGQSEPTTARGIRSQAVITISELDGHVDIGVYHGVASESSLAVRIANEMMERYEPTKYGRTALTPLLDPPPDQADKWQALDSKIEMQIRSFGPQSVDSLAKALGEATLLIGNRLKHNPAFIQDKTGDWVML